ncbi:hypothetical protein HYY69_07520 [Candidatus Woesearchaeota archaeon]|nr:hypothetical protein [Candidatus Woesearchaeota archaeon]
MENITKESPLLKRESLTIKPIILGNKSEPVSTIKLLDNLIQAREELFKSDNNTRAEAHKKFLSVLYLK